MSYCVKTKLSSVLGLFLSVAVLSEEVGDRWGTEKREREYYRVVSIPMPKGQVIEAGAFELLEVGMKVEVLYIDFGYSRVAFLIEELSRDALVEH